MVRRLMWIGILGLCLFAAGCRHYPAKSYAEPVAPPCPNRVWIKGFYTPAGNWVHGHWNCP